jgi:hypothetical protein
MEPMAELAKQHCILFHQLIFSVFGYLVRFHSKPKSPNQVLCFDYDLLIIPDSNYFVDNNSFL